MAENKRPSITSKLSKRLGRARESLRQTFGKSFKTIDEDFDRLCRNFSAHHNDTIKYQREIKQYYDSLKKFKVANKAVMNSIWDIYDPSWLESDQIQVKTDIMGKTFQRYLESFTSTVVDPLRKYISRLNELNAKIVQRDRKLLDYDASKSELERRRNSGQNDNAQIDKARRESEDSFNIYENINNELMLAIPQFQANRVRFFGPNFQHLFSIGALFHKEMGEMMAQLTIGMQLLNTSGYRTSLLETSSSSDSLPDRPLEDIPSTSGLDNVAHADVSSDFLDRRLDFPSQEDRMTEATTSNMEENPFSDDFRKE